MSIVYVINGIVILLALFDRIRAVRKERLEELVRSRGEGWPLLLDGMDDDHARTGDGRLPRNSPDRGVGRSGSIDESFEHLE